LIHKIVWKEVPFFFIVVSNSVISFQEKIGKEMRDGNKRTQCHKSDLTFQIFQSVSSFPCGGAETNTSFAVRSQFGMNQKYEEILLWTGATMVISSLLKFLSSSSNEKLHQQMASKRGHSHRRRIIEICLSDIESVKKALSGGVNSIELCVDRSGSGGLTPSYGLIKEACRVASESETKINILIRPRDGNFVYSDDEFDVMLRDIIVARDAGAHGRDIVTNLGLILI
jgi:hypothetical protein